MAVKIENIAKQLADLTPTTQAQIFVHLAALTGHANLEALAQSYQTLIDQSTSASIDTTEASEKKVTTYRAAAENPQSRGDRVSESIAEYETVQEKDSAIAMRYEELYAIFDGEVLKPEGKIDLDPNTRYKVLVEKPISGFPEIKIRAFRRIVERAIPTGIRDFAEQHDHYLYGVPKK
ncbi:MAG: hypothetical protein ONB44_16980 [candidate division KSB1 bacterium]|nr:hypothetical protein [candidate division KSB1 bacterium]MDZ7303830.1 hypothetical protein [candidate division KSB1 bacterium]MDZ7312731.1 hypothetical protein [candidate division KSB1 bacterium]